MRVANNFWIKNETDILIKRQRLDMPLHPTSEVNHYAVENFYTAASLYLFDMTFFSILSSPCFSISYT